MNQKYAIDVIHRNWPDERYSMLREALTLGIEALEENAALKDELERYKHYVDTTNYDSEKVAIKATYLEMEIEQLKAQNAALLECLKFYAENNRNTLVERYGRHARECIAKLGGERDA